MLNKPMNKLLIIFLLLLFLLPHFASAEIYKWINEDGSIGFTDEINKVPEQYRNKVEIKEYENVTPHDSEADEDSTKPPDNTIEKEAAPDDGQQETEKEPSPETEKEPSPEEEEKPANEGI